MRHIVITGSDRKGRDIEECHDMESVKAFLERPHIGDIHVYIDGCWERHHLVPKGLGVRIAHSWDESEREQTIERAIGMWNKRGIE